jgi:hypothetical protein
VGTAGGVQLRRNDALLCSAEVGQSQVQHAAHVMLLALLLPSLLLLVVVVVLLLLALVLWRPA